MIRLDREVRRGTTLGVPVAALPPPEANSYYVFQLVGLEVEEEGGRPLGRVADVSPGVANDVLELDSGLALPMVDECISEVDLAAMKHPPTTFVHDLASRLRCRKCAKAGRRPSATLLQLAWQPRHPRTEA